MTDAVTPAAEHVAIIGVHGVGSPPPFSTARAIAALLTEFAPAGEYSGFDESAIYVAVDPLIAPSPVAAQAQVADAASENSPSPEGRVAARGSVPDETHPSNATADRTELPTLRYGETAGVAFMREQLAGFDGAGHQDAYATVEICGTRRGRSTGSVQTIHVFEMHWADLSRLGSGVLRVFGAIYQLLLHVSHLGRKGVDVAKELYKEDGVVARRWKLYSFAHTTAVRAFTLVVPLSTLVMLVFLPLFVPAAIPAGARFTIGIIAAAIVIAGAVGYGLYRFTALRWGSNLFVGFLIVLCGVVWWLFRNGAVTREPAGTVLVSCLLGLTSAVAFWAIIRSYGRVRSHARFAGCAVLMITLLLVVANRSAIPGGELAERIRYAALLGFESGYLALTVSWGLVWVAALFALILSIPIIYKAAFKDSTMRARRVARTARVTLALSAFLFIVFALVGYQSVVNVAESQQSRLGLLPPCVKGTRACLPQIVPAVVTDVGVTSASKFFTALITTSGTSGFEPILVIGAVTVVLISWLVVLIAVTSVWTPSSRDPSDERSLALGRWMSSGFVWAAVAGDCLVVGIVVFILVGGIHDWLSMGASTSGFDPTATRVIVNWLAVVLVTSAAGLAVVRLRVSALASHARPALGIILDVDNYLRESPSWATPRAKMAARFASLLRHILGRRDAAGKPMFNRIVIVSHSQGTVIATDMLRFLKIVGATDPDISSVRVTLLTMGSPLRQLYAANFPHLYEWVDYNNDDSVTTSAYHAYPDPAELNVAEWVNLYTTGDYVGRSLWRSMSWPDIWRRQEFVERAQRDAPLDRYDRCLGAGTHTRYWTSADVSAEIDAMLESPLHA